MQLLLHEQCQCPWTCCSTLTVRGTVKRSVALRKVQGRAVRSTEVNSGADGVRKTHLVGLNKYKFRRATWLHVFWTAHLVSFHGVFARCKDPPGGPSSCVTLHDSHGVDVSCFTIFHDAWFVVFHATMCGDIKSRCQDANGAICRRHFRRDIFPKTPLLWMEVVKSVMLSNDVQE